jgi:hypothetical protein
VHTYPGKYAAVDGGGEERGRGEWRRDEEVGRMRIDGKLGSPYIHLDPMYVVN